MNNQRLTFIDVLRGIACIWMIETHAVNAFLDESFQIGNIFSTLRISNGFVAVLFIFCAGAGFRLAIQSKMQSYITLGKPLYQYLRRLLFILAVGYVIQTPVFSLTDCIQASTEQLMKLFQSNVLHLIVFSSLLALAALAIMRSLASMKYAAWVLMFAIFWLTPGIWSIQEQIMANLPLFLAMFIMPQPITPFPLFPWAGYFFAGYLVTEYFLSSKNKQTSAITMIVISLILFGLIYGVSKLPYTFYPDSMNWWLVSPMHMMFRCAGAMLLFATLFLVHHHLKGRIVDFLNLQGRESLVVYVGQGMLIYGDMPNKILHSLLPVPVSPLTIGLLTVTVTVVMGIYTYYWNTYKRTMPVHAAWTLTLVSMYVVILFVVS